MKKKNKKDKVFLVTVEWVCDSGESDCDTHPYDRMKKAKGRLREESLAELRDRAGETVYLNADEADEAIFRDLVKEFDNGGFEIVEKEEDAKYVIEVTPGSFSCYRQGEYCSDHFNVNIKENEIN